MLEELAEVLRLLARSAPKTVRRAVDLQQAFRIDAPLAWRVFKIATADDPLLAAPHVPTRGQFETLLEAAARAGAAPDLLKRARAAVDAYEELQSEHANDRRTLDAMIASLRPSAASQIDLRTRRSAFRENSRIWGLQAKASALTTVLYTDEQRGGYRAASISGLVGLHAVRPDVPLVLRGSVRFKETDDEKRYRAWDEPDLLREFCSPELEVRTEVSEDQTVVRRIAVLGMGRRAAVDAYSLAVSEAHALERRMSLGLLSVTPSELMQLELWVPVGASDPDGARMAVYGRRTDVARSGDMRPADRLPIQEPALHLGATRDAPPAEAIPQWPDIMRHALDKLGATGTFDVYRCRIPYPVLHSYSCLTVETRGRTGGS